MTPVAGSVPRLVTPPVIVARSWPSKRARRTAAGATDRLMVLPSPTATGENVVPAGRRWSSLGVHPFFWKSVISTTSRRGRDDSATIVPATLSAGA